MPSPKTPKILKFKKLAVVSDPRKATEGSAGFDLAIPNSFTIDCRRVKCLTLGIAVQIPEGYVGLLKLRSSMAKKYGMTMISSGVIDSDYRGELKAYVSCHGNRPLSVLEEDTYVFQLVVLPCPVLKAQVVEELTLTGRGDGGFGSTDEEK